MSHSWTPKENPERIPWDAIVVGTGMGGAVLGYTLAKSGLKVLFLEKGASNLPGATALRDVYPEMHFPKFESPHEGHRQILAHGGRYHEALDDISGRHGRRFIPHLGCGTGGSSALFGMAMERFRPSDFDPQKSVTSSREHVSRKPWPIRYEDLLSYYREAEKLFRVSGGIDPLRIESQKSDRLLPPPNLSKANREFFNFLSAKSLHPYQLPLACDYSHGDDRSQSMLDSSGAKNDAGKICLLPALQKHGAHLIDRCEVVRLNRSGCEVREVCCNWNGRNITLRAKTVVLAAGALATPRILLNSTDRNHPNGIGNKYDLVGRYLMRHFLDIYLIALKNKGPYAGNVKQVGLNDFYDGPNGKLGTFQSFGLLPPIEKMVADLKSQLSPHATHPLSRLFKSSFALAKPFIKFILNQKISRSLALASVLEDLPCFDNRVTLSNHTTTSGMRRLEVTYRLDQQARSRINLLRRLIKDTIKPYSFIATFQAEQNIHLAHACGTCRMGNDAKDSVVDANQRVHGVNNLYISDASTFPSSGGTNPGLTIAANALRVGNQLLNRHARPTAKAYEKHKSNWQFQSA